MATKRKAPKRDKKTGQFLPTSKSPTRKRKAPAGETMTQAEYNRVGKSRKTKVDGKPYLLKLNKNTGATVLVPVTIRKPKRNSSRKRKPSRRSSPQRRKFRKNPRGQWVKRTPGRQLTTTEKAQLETQFLDKYGTAFTLQALRDIAEDRGEFFVQGAAKLRKIPESSRTLTEKTHLDIGERKGAAWWNIADYLEKAFYLAVGAGVD